MNFFSIKKNAWKNLIINLRWKEFIGEKPYSYCHTKDEKISFYDWWHENAENDWFTRFLNFNFPNYNKKINFYSVFGNNAYIKKKILGKKVFYTAENIKKNDYCLDIVDLSLGFQSFTNASNYLYLPGWMLFLIPPESTEKEIVNIIDRVNSTKNENVIDNAVLIARHDIRGTRKMIADGVSDILKITYAGKWRNNTTDLWKKYDDNKIEYLKNFKFNICPENSNTHNYVTEKIFQSFVAGTIPIYYGAENNPEPEIINKASLIYWNKDDNRDNLNLIMNLKLDREKYLSFIEQPKFLPTAAECIIKRLEGLKMKFREILS